MTDEQLTRIWIAIYLTMTLVGLLCIIFVPVHAAGAPGQVPYLDGCDNGVCTVYYPNVPGYNSGLLEVVNTCTGESGPLYLTWQAQHPLDMGRYTTDPRQLMIMGECVYVVTDGWVGIQEVYLPSDVQVFNFENWRLWLAVLR